MRTAALLPLVLLAGCGQAEVRVCEDMLKDRLKSPASYKRVSAEVEKRGISEAEFANLVGHAPLAPSQPNDPKPEVVFVHIAYDASNAFGVPLRGRAKCSFPYTGTDSMTRLTGKIEID